MSGALGATGRRRRRAGRGALAGLLAALAGCVDAANPDSAGDGPPPTSARATTPEALPPALPPAPRELCGPDAAPELAIALCPAPPTGAAALRTAVLAIDAPSTGQRLLPRLAAAPDLAGLVRLAILDRAATPATTLASPADAVVSPIDDAVLAQVALALRVRYDPAASHADRLRALALLARVYNEALLQLGLGEDEALPPFARLLAGRFLHCGRELVQSYTQRRVAGLEALVPAIERRLFAVSVALQSTPHAGDDALLAYERHRTRRHLRGHGARLRIVEATRQDPRDSLGWWPDEAERLVDQRLDDLAIERALAESGEYDRDATLTAMLGILGRHGREDGRRLAVERFTAAEPGEARMALEGGSPAPTPHLPGPDADTIARALADDLDGPRRPAVAAALLRLRDRPDAIVALLDRIVPRSAGSTEAGRSSLVPELGWILAAEAAARLDPTTRLRLEVAAARIRPADPGDAQEAALRRRFALAARTAEAAADARKADEGLLARAAAARAATAEAEADPGGTDGP